MTDIDVPDTEDIASTDKSILVDIARSEIGASGKDMDKMSDTELANVLRGVAGRIGTKVSARDFGPRLSVQRDPEQGITFKRERDFTLGEQVRGRPSPPEAFWQGIPEAMATAIGEVNRQVITEDVDTRIEVEKLPGSVDVISGQTIPKEAAGKEIFEKAEEKGLPSMGEGLRREATQGPSVDVMEGQREFNSQMERLRKKEVKAEDEATKAVEFTNFTNEVLAITASAEDEAGLTRNGRNALKRLSRHLQDNIRMGKPLDAVELESLAEDPRYEEAFDILEGMSDGSIPITVGGIIDKSLEGLQITSEVLMGVPALAPGAKFVRLGALAGRAARRTAVSQAAKTARKREAGAKFALREERSAQENLGRIITSEQGGKTVGTVKVRKFIGKPEEEWVRIPSKDGLIWTQNLRSNPPPGGLGRVGKGGRRTPDKFRESPKREIEGTLKPENIPTRRAMTGENRFVGLIIPLPGMDERKIKEIEEVQTDTLNYIAARENFRATPYQDGDRKSIGLGTEALEGDKKITEQVAFERAQQRLEREVYPEIERIQDESGIIFNNNQITALSSLLYNIGVGETWKNSDALRALIDGDIDTFLEEAFDPQKGFVYSGGKLMRGLQNRRGKDLTLFNKAVPEKRPDVPIA